MQLSLSGFLFEDGYAAQSVTFAEFCAFARGAGYDGVELRRTQVNPETPKPERARLLRTVRDEGLTVTCLTARGLPDADPRRDDFFLRYLALCHEMDCPLLKIASDPAWLHQAAERAQAQGVALAVNNHIGGPLETVAGARAYLASVNHPNFGLLFDPLHLYINGEDHVGCIAEFANVTRNILVHSARLAAERLQEHAAPITWHGRTWIPALPDEPGVQNWPALFTAYRQRGYDGLVTVIESGWPRDRRKQVGRRCAAAVRGFWEQRDKDPSLPAPTP
ncbi:MAG TPA: sugar phosphate isomerase/epimerase [Candidatus Hydrogenedentes bacterium]|nr:sugar phosphate isomerase/epimerase [Candidatus Hydrogenedentota bacterium]HIJ73432.1 sugar phosphate isomerase/epimerase [Candidatus Hydrogenedentota bacterium]